MHRPLLFYYFLKILLLCDSVQLQFLESKNIAIELWFLRRAAAAMKLRCSAPRDVDGWPRSSLSAPPPGGHGPLPVAPPTGVRYPSSPRAATGRSLFYAVYPRFHQEASSLMLRSASRASTLAVPNRDPHQIGPPAAAALESPTPAPRADLRRRREATISPAWRVAGGRPCPSADRLLSFSSLYPAAGGAPGHWLRFSLQ